VPRTSVPSTGALMQPSMLTIASYAPDRELPMIGREPGPLRRRQARNATTVAEKISDGSERCGIGFAAEKARDEPPSRIRRPSNRCRSRLASVRQVVLLVGRSGTRPTAFCSVSHDGISQILKKFGVSVYESLTLHHFTRQLVTRHSQEVVARSGVLEPGSRLVTRSPHRPARSDPARSRDGRRCGG
jgi:hypothetical protein